MHFDPTQSSSSASASPHQKSGDEQRRPEGSQTTTSSEPPRSHLRPWQGLVTTLVGFIAAHGIGAVLIVLVLVFRTVESGEPLDLEALLSDPFLMALSVVVPGSALVLVATLVVLLTRGSWTRSLGFRTMPALWVMGVGTLGTVGMALVSAPLIAIMLELGLTFGVLAELNEFVSSTPFLLVLLLVAVLPSFAEELFFRGMLQRSLGRGTFAISIAALLFASFHVDPAHVVGVLPLSFYLSWLADRTGSTWAPMAGHFANNTLSVLSIHLGSDLESTELSASMLALATVGLAVGLLSAWAITRGLRRSAEKTTSPVTAS